MPHDIARRPIKERFDHLCAVMSGQRFLQKQGLGNEAPFFICPYLREFRAKLLARKNHLEALGISASTSQGEKTKTLKEIEKISKMIAEVDAYERDTLYPLATQQLEIDLDDDVKANYPKFGAALKKVPGLEAKDD